MVCVLSNVFISICSCSMLNVWCKTKCDLLLLYGLHCVEMVLVEGIDSKEVTDDD